MALVAAAVGVLPGAQGVDPVLYGSALVFADFIELVQRQPCLQDLRPVAEARAWVQQGHLPDIELARHVAAQALVAVNHLVQLA